MAELREKCLFFRTNGVEACWLIDPDARTAELFEGERDGVLTTGALTAAALPGFLLSLDALFAVLQE
jgi:Uma2 family endonuclease